ncbi:polysaccharide deacetylase family protein [Candidatus Roizmanbacteria bacterium]|nr:polysaccharide deacetylase family protein [Candidatus Roizmanbacteria bacterium]
MTYGKRGIFVRIAYLVVAMLFFAASKMKGNTNRGKIVLCYHGVKNSQKFKFAKQLNLIKNRAVASKNLASVGELDTETSHVCLTFDDAFANLLPNVIPVITELQIPIAIFIPTGSLGTFPPWLQGLEHSDSTEMILSVVQISALLGNPLVSFGSHTVDHPRLSLLQEEEIHAQLRTSRDIISGIVGEKITELALPYGDYNEVVIQIALEEGYQKIYTLEPEAYVVESRSGTPLLGRFSVSPDDWPVEFFLTINGAYAWLAPWRAFLRTLRS